MVSSFLFDAVERETSISPRSWFGMKSRGIWQRFLRFRFAIDQPVRIPGHFNLGSFRGPNSNLIAVVTEI